MVKVQYKPKYKTSKINFPRLRINNQSSKQFKDRTTKLLKNQILARKIIQISNPKY